MRDLARTLAIVGIALAMTPAAAQSTQPWPSRPLRIVVPFAPGGTTDLIGRMVAEGLTQALGQPVVVDNKAGAGGNLGAAEVARAASDAGSTGHIALEMLKQQAKVDIAHVPYKGASQAIADLLGGRIRLSADNVPTALPVSAAVPGLSLNLWFVVVAPAGTPKAIVERTSAAIDAYIKQPAVAAKLRELGAIPVGGPPERLAAHLATEQKRFGEAIANTGLKAE